MTLTAREAMQALLDGKILKDGDGRYWRMSDEGELQTKWEAKDDWIRAGSIWNGDCTIQEEYPLTFEQALTAMLDGKVVMCKELFNEYAYRFHNGRFESAHASDFFPKWEQDDIPSYKQNSKWKVVG